VSSANPSLVGAYVTFTATVRDGAPTGSVGFTAEGTPLSGCGAAALPSGSANASPMIPATDLETLVAAMVHADMERVARE
jgi:hypothetical protein